MSYESTMLKLEKMAAANTATQMNWQEKMSKTSHQMEVNDLIQAGLNPVLSANQGANSYTTSVDSAVNGIASMASARESASATKFAARQSAAATRAAAAAQLAAAKYSADKSYEASIYSTDHSKSGSLPGVLSEIFNRGIKNEQVSGTLGNTFANILKAVDKVRSKNPESFLHDPNKEFSWKNMNAKGIRTVNQQMAQFGVKRTRQAQDIFIDAFYNHDKNSMIKWTALVRAANKNKSSANAIKNLYNY